MVTYEPSFAETAPLDLPPEIVANLAAFAPLFSDRTWVKAQALAVGALLAAGNRTVCAVLRVLGLSQERHFTNYHRVLNRDAWSCLAAGQVLLGLIVTVLPRDCPIVLAADDTIERRKGRCIRAKGCYRDPVRSSRKHVVKCFGLKWVALMVLVPVPWSRRAWALPILTTLSWPEGSGRRPTHKTAIDWARQMVAQVRRWLPDRELILVTDGGFAAVDLARACQRHRVARICRLRFDAALYHPPGPQPPGRRGRKPKKGARQRRLTEWASRSDTPWDRVEVPWYGGRCKLMQVFSRTGLWHRRGCDPVAIRYLLARDPEGEQPDTVYFCTDERFGPEEILGYVVQRWSGEVTFEEARAHLGLETQRQWSDLAIARTTPVLLSLFSVVTPAALRCHEAGLLTAEQTAWSAEEEPTFSDCLRLIRGRIWQARISGTSEGEAEVIALPRGLFEAVIQGLSTAA
ncbi:MAG: transposase [Isosphaeraceae bacterium]|nr:transposase [Isosphaeraceae bacterium]